MNEPQSTDSQLVQDVLLLSGIFEDTSPGADTRVFELLHRVVERLRLTDRLEAALTAAQGDAERFAFCNAINFNEVFAKAVDPHMEYLNGFETENADQMREFLDSGIRTAVGLGLWPLKDGAQ